VLGQRGPTLLAVGSVVLAALLWSSSYAVTKLVLAEVGPLTIGAIRFTLAAGVLFVMVRLYPNRVTRPDARQRRLIYLSGLLGITAYFILENFGVKLSNAADASIIVATYPLMTMLVELLILRRPVPLLRACAVLLAGGGATLVVHNGVVVGGAARWHGDALLLGAGLVWAGYNELTKRAGRGQDSITLTYYQTLAGAAGFLLASVFEYRDWRMPDTMDAALLCYLAVACSVGGFLCYNYGLRRMPSSLAVNVLNLVPVFGVTSAILIDGETVQAMQLLGGVMTIAGVSLGMLERADPAAREASPATSQEPSIAVDREASIAEEAALRRGS
jgi:drug/metabolite transporter (DMT)-like permease